MPDANNTKFYLMSLFLLFDLEIGRSYSWGSAVLTTLYLELCQTTKHNVQDIGGCLILLQS